MATYFDDGLRTHLVTRQQKLQSAVASFPGRSDLAFLLYEVDAALSRMDLGSFGLCEVCHEPIERERLAADPLVRFCLDHLTAPQQRALEQDLDLAARIQSALLPKAGLVHGGWRTAFHFQPAGPVSGDYCDFIPTEDGSLFFILGDVSGKGVAASMLMVHLQATFRTLIPMGLPLRELVERASRVFCESTLPTHYASLVCGRAAVSGEVEICNAGHPPPLLLRRGEALTIEPTGMLLGAFCDEQFATSRLRVGPGEAILLYTDGLSEARNEGGRMYGTERIRELALGWQGSPPHALIELCLADLTEFRKDARSGDDLTIMAVCRSAPG